MVITFNGLFVTVVAGGAGRNCAVLSTVEMYDPREGSWRSGPSLRQGRRGFGLVSLDVSHNFQSFYSLPIPCFSSQNKN